MERYFRSSARCWCTGNDGWDNFESSVIRSPAPAINTNCRKGDGSFLLKLAEIILRFQRRTCSVRRFARFDSRRLGIVAKVMDMTQPDINTLVETLTEVDVANKRVISMTQRLNALLEEVTSLKKKIDELKKHS